MHGIGIAGKSAIFNQLGICGAHKLKKYQSTFASMPVCALYAENYITAVSHGVWGYSFGITGETLPKRSTSSQKQIQ